MVDMRDYKCFRLFSLPYRPLALNLMVNSENTVLGYDNCGYSYVGKLGKNFKISLVSFNPNEETTCLMGTIDFDKKRIIGNWLTDEYLEDAILEMVSYSSKSLLESLPEGNINLTEEFLKEDLLEKQASNKVKKYLIREMI